MCDHNPTGALNEGQPGLTMRSLRTKVKGKAKFIDSVKPVDDTHLNTDRNTHTHVHLLKHSQDTSQGALIHTHSKT